MPEPLDFDDNDEIDLETYIAFMESHANDDEFYDSDAALATAQGF